MTDFLRLSWHTLALSWRADRKSTTIVGVIVLLEALSVVAVAWSQRWVVDTAVDHTLTALAIAALMGGVAFAVGEAGNRIVLSLQDTLAEKVDIALNEEVLEITTRARTLEHLEQEQYHDRVVLLGNGIRELAKTGTALCRTISAFLSVGLSVALLTAVHPLLGPLVLLALPPIGLSLVGQRRKARARLASAADARRDERLHKLAIEAESAQQIRAMAAESLIGEWADAARRRGLRTNIRANFSSAGQQAIGWVLYAAGYTTSLVIVGGLVGQGLLTVGSLVLVVTIGSRLRGEVRRAVTPIQQLAHVASLGEHLKWLRDFGARSTESAGTKPAPTRLETIELREVSFTYPGTEAPVLENVNLTLRGGETLAIVGPNGAGKTTLIKLVTGMYAPTKGSVLVNGAPLTDIDHEDWRRLISAAFQDSVRLRTTVFEAVGVGDLEYVEDAERVHGAMKRAGADALVRNMPDGTATLLDPTMGGSNLSGGQWQRLALARACMRERPLVQVLDEPSAALDPQAEHEIHQLFLEQTADQNRQLTLLVSHRFSTVQMADRIAVVNRGGITEIGTHAELMANKGLYAKLYQTQAAQYL